MADLFAEKAQDWDQSEMRTQLAAGIGSAVLERVDFHPNMAVMDFGAGTGLISGQVASKVGKITAVDVSESMLEQLAAKPELQGKVRTVCQDITEQPLDEEFDVIVSAMAMHHVENTDKLAKTFAEHLKPGGEVALADLDKEDGSFHPAGTEGVYHSGFDREAMKSILENNGFGNIEFVTAHTVNKETGNYPIFLVTARKL
ncbi:MAG TPA: class I SAM-dependent methyltransferase [Gammaproteobacteria bacterium]|nr:class I SAM-dependent methyltransferase [Gammaproteobacteria bacterium]